MFSEKQLILTDFYSFYGFNQNHEPSLISKGFVFLLLFFSKIQFVALVSDC